MRQHLSPRDLALAIGASESSVKRWADEGLIDVVRTKGGHRRIALREAIRYIRQTGISVLNPQALGLAELAAAPRTSADGSWQETLSAAIQEGDAQRVRGMLLAHYIAGGKVSDLCDGPLTTAMHAVGQLWRHSAEGIFIEHRAVDVCIQALENMRSVIPDAAADAPAAMGGALEGDPYHLPTLMVATVLASQGWRATNLGPNLPLEALLSAVTRHKPSLVWMSCSAEEVARGQLRDLRRTARLLAERSVRMMVGGRGFNGLKADGENLLNPMGTMAEASAFAEGLRGTLV